jgi:hypothetical protein
MGVLTDLVIADKSEAEAVARSVAPWEGWRWVEAKGHDEFTLGALLCVLRGESYREAVSGEFPLLAQVSEEGPWVFAVPEALPVALQRLDDGRISGAVSEWLRTEEMRDADREGAEIFVRELKGLAAEAVARRTPILMWVSL